MNILTGDDEDFRKGLFRVRRLCFRERGLPTAECWCIHAGPNGHSIPCNEATIPMPIDMLGREQTDTPAKPPQAQLEPDYCCG